MADSPETDSPETVSPETDSPETAASGTDASGTDTLGDRVAAFRKSLRKELAPLDKALKALDALVGAGATDDVEVLDARLPALRDARLAPLGLAAAHEALVSELAARHTSLAGRARMQLLGRLKQAAEGAGVPMQVVSERPLIVSLSPVEVELSPAAGTGIVRYAREQVEDCDADAASVLKARVHAMEVIKSAALPSGDFFGHLLRAYRMTLAARDLPQGERVDLVDLLRPLSLLRDAPDTWRKRPLAKVQEMPKYLLAYQLQRLRRDGLLTHDGVRLELGVATGGTARDKRNVVFVPTGPGDGQYQLSIRFEATS